MTKQPKWKRRLLCQAIAVASISLAPTAAMAACPDTVVTGPEGACTMLGTESVTVNASGSISTSGTTALYVSGTLATGSSITNNGTISASATSYATGIYVSGSGGVAGSITNTGTIAAVASSSYQATAYGIYASDVTGTINSSGQINASASTSSSSGSGAYAYGIYLDSILSGGQVTNSGTITVTADASYYAEAYGIRAYWIGSDGTLTNSGSIDVSASASSSSAYAYGLYIEDYVESGGLVENSGTITVEANAPSYTAYAYGIFLDSSAYSGGQVINSGSISVTANGSSAEAYGIWSDEYIYSDGRIENSGTITVQANADYDGEGYGIYLSSTTYSGGKIINSGSISVAVTAGTDAEAYGIFQESYLYGTDTRMENSGTISVSAVATSGSASAYGIYQSYSVYSGAQLTNSGSISASATGTNYAYAYGIYNYYALYDTGSLMENSGTITVSAIVTGTGGSATASAIGIYIDDSIYSGAQLINSGSINVSAQAADGSATAIGISATDEIYDGALINSGTINVGATGNYAWAAGINQESSIYSGGELTNSGVITANATGSTSAWASGMYLASANIYSGGQVTNSGSINAQASGDYAYARGIWVGNSLYGTDSLLENSGTIDVTALGDTWASDYGIRAYSVFNDARLENSGSINVGANAQSGNARAMGIHLESSVYSGGMVVNSGSINVAATGSSAYAYGMRSRVLSDSGTLLDNSGTISVTANATGNSGSANATGVSIGTMISDASFTNSGIIEAIATGANSVANSIRIGTGSGTVSNLAGGQLIGGMDLGGTVSLDNSGRVLVTLGNPATIGGNYSGSGSLAIEVDSVDSYSTINVTGTADLSEGSLEVVTTDSAMLSNGDVLEDVISAGTLTTAGELEVEDDSLLYIFSAIDDGDNHIDLEVELLSLEEAVATTGPEYAIGAAGALDAILTSGEASEGMEEFIEILGGMETVEELSAAVAETVPVLVGQSAQLAMQTVSEVANVVDARVGAVQGLSSGDEAASIMKDQRVWVQPFGTSAEQDAVDDTPGYDVDSYGLAIGADAQVSDEWLAGVAIAYSEADIKGNTISKNEIDVNSFQLVGYSSFTPNDKLAIDMIVSLGYNDNDSERYFSFTDQKAKADYNSWYGRLYVNSSYDFEMNDSITLTPVVSLGYTYVEEDSYTEKGAGAISLDVDSNDEDSLILGLDGLAAFGFNDNRVILTTKVGVGYDFLTDESVISSSYVGGGPVFGTAGSEPDELVYNAGVSADVLPGGNWELKVKYEYQGREDFDNQTLSARVRWAF